MMPQIAQFRIKREVHTIQEVIDQLDLIIDWAEDKASPMAYFPCLYRRVTIAVANGIKQGFFDDGPRMEKLDVIFANRYFEAFDQYLQGEVTTESWKFTFRAAEEYSPLVIQHLLLGINAHINLDLGIAAGQTLEGDAIMDLVEDFNRIN